MFLYLNILKVPFWDICEAESEEAEAEADLAEAEALLARLRDALATQARLRSGKIKEQEKTGHQTQTS